MFLLDLTHTSHTHARTGVQRVCRALHAALAAEGSATALTHDPYRRAWRPLAPWETATLAADSPSKKRSARWPWRARAAGRLARFFEDKNSRPALPPSEGLIVPEIFSPSTAAALPELFSRVSGPRVTIFYDAIALKFPELTPPKTVARFPGYLRELLLFDGVSAISEDSRQSLLDYWRWLGVTAHPPVQTIPLALDHCNVISDNGTSPKKSDSIAPASSANASSVPDHCHVIRDNGLGRTPAKDAPPVVLSVGTLEGRKNHLALLAACEALWARGLVFELHLIGLAHAQTGRAALEKVRALQAAGRALRYDGPVNEDALHAAYARCAFTVYPSLYEGFGLPVLESLSHGKPCLCSAGSALGESARDGGCLTVAQSDAPALTDALARLLTSPELRARLTAEARARVFKNWSTYAAELTAWMRTLGR